ncbi:MAG: hypothetical protein KBB88_01965 [Candidatus Pacebacteria bacterium]|nr:hypothetical protein [Candidatus Paceibacterota bacterium]
MTNTLTSFFSYIVLGILFCSCTTTKEYTNKKPTVNVEQKKLADSTFGNVLTKDSVVISSLSEYLPAFTAPDIPFFYIVKNKNILGGEFLFYGDRENDCIREVLYLSDWVGYYEEIIEKTFYFSNENRTFSFLVTMNEKALDNKRVCAKRTYYIDTNGYPKPILQEYVPWKMYKKIKRTTKKNKKPELPLASGFFILIHILLETVIFFLFLQRHLSVQRRIEGIPL